MRKLSAGFASAALAATTIACSIAPAHAVSTWPAGFTPLKVTATSGGTLFVAGEDGDGNPDLVRVAGGTPSLVDLGEDASPADLTVQGTTAYVVGTLPDEDGDDIATLWTIGADGTVVTTALPSDATAPVALAVSADGTELGVVGSVEAAVYPVVGLGDATVPTATTSVTALANVGSAAFDPTGGTFEFSGTSTDGTSRLWSIGSHAAAATPTTVALGPGDVDTPPTALAVAADGTSYVATTGDDPTLYAVKGGTRRAAQPIDGADSLLVSADGRTVYATGDGSITAYAVASLGSYDDEEDTAPSYTPPTDALVLTLDRGVLTAVETSQEDSAPVIDRLATPGAPSRITAERDATTADVAFTPSTTGSSAWPHDTDDLLTYAVTLHDTTHPAVPDLVTTGETDPTDVMLGYDDVSLVAGDAYTISVTATNGLLTSAVARGTLAAQPAKVRKIKVGSLTSKSKKLTITLTGATSVPGTVSVYDGKKLLGSSKVKAGKLVVKLKKKLKKGKHTITAKYAGSATVLKFTKSATVKVS
ncbi:Ig-like domain repeat protein [Nocardioides sp. BP30]|uniref:Ig-like domain repeat protein n=1 Tax=Nocardioides sp. BP30 TaxID=3036374 RepID=UPI0024694FC4|nr:Ig-like domain repeat protein [Nocardioides sp. BP30]WGL51759.1 Ig-like domain repeat protein [Nocardioides sp. BP30]